MIDNITFVDLISLIKITPDATVEKFGSMINSSFFDASNILGTLKQKGLVDFVTAFPTQSALTVTEEGKKLIAEVEAKATTTFDTLDLSILTQLSGGKRNLPDLMSAMNITGKDLAFHLYKLSIQQYLSYELRNGNITLLLTEKGFLSVKEGMPKPETATMQASAPPSQGPTTAAPGATPTIEQAQKLQSEEELKAIDSKIAFNKKINTLITVIIVLVVIALVVYAYFFTNLIK